jgi:hypothetical protein
MVFRVFFFAIESLGRGCFSCGSSFWRADLYLGSNLKGLSSNAGEGHLYLWYTGPLPGTTM